MKTEKKKIVFYDGDCGFCSNTVNFIMDNEKGENTFFCTLQSDFAKELFKSRNISIKLDTLYYLDNGHLYSKFSAFVMLSKNLKSPLKYFYYFRFIFPQKFGDFFYDIVANNRYKIAGKSDSCRLPSTEERRRFIA